ncbi:MAG: integrin alpha, partial [Phycisphaeraceae bacterium]
VGDVNGDDLADFIIGAPEDDTGGDKAGRVYLIPGKTSGWAMDTDLSTADASFIGEDAGDKAGQSVAGVGNVNGDGFDDFVIGAPDDETGGSRAGQVYLLFGSSYRVVWTEQP